MADNLTSQRENAIVTTLENTLRNPDAQDTGKVFQEQMGNLSHGEQQQIITKINQDKQAEGYGKDNPLPQLTLQDDGVVSEKIASNPSQLNVWQGNSGGSFDNHHKAPDSYAGTLEHGGWYPAADSFTSDLWHDPIGALKAAGQTVADVASGAKDAVVQPVKKEIQTAQQGHE